MKTIHAYSASLLTMLLLATGCGTLAPKSSALREVHDTYRADFAQLFLPGPSSNGAPDQMLDAPFTATLRAIRDFRVAHGEASPEAAHLKVLEGMIYLQSGKVGMARLVQNDVAAAANRLTAAGGLNTRDALFAANFPALVLGWGEIAEATDKLPDGSDNDETFPESAKLLAAADAISAHLLRESQANRLGTPEADEGAVFLATTAAIFYVWAHELTKGSDPELSREIQSARFPQVRDLIGRFLSPSERVAAAGLAPGEVVPSARLRYLQWFQWLN